MTNRGSGDTISPPPAARRSRRIARAHPVRLLAWLLFAAGLAAGTGACDHFFDPKRPEQFDMQRVAGDTQRAVVGTALADTLVVHMGTNRKTPVRGGPVSWWVMSGGGQVRACRGDLTAGIVCGAGTVQVLQAGATDENGLAKAIWILGPQPGPQTLVATLNDARPEAAPAEHRVQFTATAISNAVHTITISPDTGTLFPGQSRPFSYTLSNALGTVVTGRNVIVFSSNVNVLDLNDARTEVRGVAPGEADLVVQSEGKEARARFRVLPRPVSTVVLSPDTVSLSAGETRQLTAAVTCVGGPCDRAVPVTWASSDTLVAKVSTSGVVTAVSAGTATVSGTSEGQRGTARVTVAPRAPAGLVFTQLSAGGTHTCGIAVGGRAYCWGRNVDGALGDGTTDDRLTPTPVAGDLVFRSISAAPTIFSASHTCGVTTAGTAYCWGTNDQGQLGDSTRTFRSRPTPVAGGLTFSGISAGEAYTCAVTTGRKAYCWGSPGAHSANSTGIRALTPRLVSDAISLTTIAAGSFSTCGVSTGGGAYCWGRGMLGDGNDNGSFSPVLVNGGHSFAAVRPGGGHICGATTGGAAYCWGGNNFGQLGTGDLGNRNEPALVTGGLTFRGVTPGTHHTCGVTTAGSSYCWGTNANGQLGVGDLAQRISPTRVSGGLTFASISAGAFHTCALDDAGRAYCWGSNGRGELGDGTRTARLTPTPLAPAPASLSSARSGRAPSPRRSRGR